MPRYSDPVRQALFIQRLKDSHKGKLVGDQNPAKRPEVRATLSIKGKGRKRPDITGEKNYAKDPKVREKIKNNPNNIKTRFKKGQTPHNKGKTAETYEPTKRDAEKRKGAKRTEEQKLNIKRGLPPDHGEKAREKLFRNIKLGKWGKPSKHEDELEAILIELDLVKNKDFFSKYRVDDASFDFFIPQKKLIIETDGREHIYDKEVKENDIRKLKILQNNGLHLVRFSDFDIFNNRDQVKAWIKEYISDDEPEDKVEVYCSICKNLCIVTDIFMVDKELRLYRGIDSNLHLVEFSM